MKKINNADFLKAMANKNRLTILLLLKQYDELSVTELNAKISLSQSALSQHLAVLRREGLVVTRRSSQTIYYSLDSPLAEEILTLLDSRSAD